MGLSTSNTITSGTGTPSVVTGAITAGVAGDTIVVLLASAGADKLLNVSSIVMTNVTNWRRAKQSNTNFDIEAWIGDATGPTGTTATITMSGNFTAIARGVIVKCSGIDNANAPEAVSCTANSGAATTTPGTTASTPTAGRGYTLIAFGRGGNATAGPTGGFTTVTSGNASVMCASLEVPSATGTAFSTSWTTNSATFDMVLIALPYVLNATPATIITTQPAASTVSGVAMSSVVAKDTIDGTSVNTSSSANCTASLTGPNGSLAGTVTVACVNGVATFNNLIPTADGPGFTLSFSIGGRSVTSTPFTVIGATVSANQALVTSMGGNASLFFNGDPRIYANGALASFTDAIGTIGGRAASLTLTQPTAGNRPVVSGGKLTFDSALSQWMESAADARMNLNASTPLYLLVIAQATGVGPLAALTANPATASYPEVGIQAAGSNWKADYAPTGSADRSQPDFGVAFNDGAVRSLVAGKASRYAVSGQGGYNEVTHFGLGGKQMQRYDAFAVATSGSLKLSLGQLAGAFGKGAISWVGVFAGDLTSAKYQAFLSFAKTQFGATMAPRYATIVMSGSSLEQGLQGTDAKTTVVGSGTTSPSYVAANRNTGRGTLASLGIDAVDIHSFNYGTGGFDYVGMNSLFDTDLALAVDGQASGPFIFFSFEIGNTAQNLLYTSAQILAQISALTAKIHALGGLHYVHTCPDRGPFYTPNKTGTINSIGVAARDTNIALRTNTALYCDGFIETERDPSNAFVIDRKVVKGVATNACEDATYFPGSTHMTDAGYAIVGNDRKDFIDTVVFPPLPAGLNLALSHKLGHALGHQLLKLIARV